MGINIGKALGGSLLGGTIMGPVGAAGGAFFGGTAGETPKAGVPQVPMPEKPQFQGLGQLGELPSNFQVNPNTQGLEALRNVALGGGPSPFAQALIDQQQNRANTALGNIGQQSAGALGNVQNAMASTSGLSGQAADRLSQSADRQALFAKQNVRSQFGGARDAILGTDADLKQRALNTLPGLEVQALQPDKFNIQNAISEKGLQDNFNLGLQDLDNKMIAAQFQSDAIKNSGSKGLLGDLGSYFGL